jgi:O-antigen/teichoic acid export membrane protein
MLDGLEGQTVDGLLEAPSDTADVLRTRTAKGSLWTLVGYGMSQVIRLAGNLILWRLLYAEAFGLMALVNVLIQGLAMFSDIGIGPSIVQHQRGNDPTYLNTAWTIQVLRGFALCLAAVALTAPMAAFYKDKQLLALVPVAALGTIIAGFNSARLFSQTRKIALGRLTFIDLASQVVTLVAMIGWAWAFRSVWAIVVGGMVGSLVRLVLSHTFLPGVPDRFRWDRESLRTLLHFGRWIFFSTLLTFLVMQSDRLIFGKLIPMALLGVYSIATTWATLPLSILERIFNAVLFPLLSRLHEEGSDFSASFLKARRPWMLLGGWATAGLIAGGPTLIHLLYDNRATSAGWIVQLLAAGIWFLVLENANGTALLALGQPKWVAAGNAAKLIGMVVLIPIGFIHFGFPGAVLAFAGSEILRYATSVVGARRFRVACFGQDMALTALVAGTSTLGLLAAHGLKRWLGPIAFHPAKLGNFLQGLGIAVCVSFAWAVAFLVQRAKQSRLA